MVNKRMAGLLARAGIACSLAAALAAAVEVVAQAQTADPVMQEDAPSIAVPATASGNERAALIAALKKDLAQMETSQNADRDFATLYQLYGNAVARMAKDELKNGQDPEIKRLARQVLHSQQRAQQQVSSWLDLFHRYD